MRASVWAVLILSVLSGVAHAGEARCLDDREVITATFRLAGSYLGETDFPGGCFGRQFRSRYLTNVESLWATYKENYGSDITLEPSHEIYRARIGPASFPVYLLRNREQEIVDVRYSVPVLSIRTAEEARHRLLELPGAVSAVVVMNGTARLGYEAHRPLGVFSAMKLGVLKVLHSHIASGAAKWEDVIFLEESQKTLGSGEIAYIPGRVPFTLRSLAALMMGWSDNSATDVIIDHLGRDKVAGDLGMPLFMRFAEYFKIAADPVILDQYRKGTDAERATIIRAVRLKRQARWADLPPGAIPELNWFASAEQLCGWMESVRDLDFLSLEVDRGSLTEVVPHEWKRVASKGGSGPGALSETFWGERSDGTRVCVSLTLNMEREVPGGHFYAVLGSLIEWARTM